MMRIIRKIDGGRSDYWVGLLDEKCFFAWACDRSASDADVASLLREAAKAPGHVFGTSNFGAIVGIGPEVRSEIQACAMALSDEAVAAQVRALADDIPAGSRQLRAYPQIDGSSDWHISRQDALLLAEALQLKIRELEQRIAAIRNPEPNPETDWLTPLLDPDGSNAQLQIELLERELQRARDLCDALR